MKSNQPLTAPQWIAKAAQYQDWEASWEIALETLMDQLAFASAAENCRARKGNRAAQGTTAPDQVAAL
jgi:hypothetical protein